MMRAGAVARLATGAAFALLLLAGCSNEGAYGDPWTNRAQEERLGDEGERDPETAKALRERARYNQADR
ncbi:hypothetical protein [Sediminicurvatus halobius]|uniref:Lipoprotein n=1 Tax=Sediminicurvatus halobius TaxID=2182432 RepID=A0A2U2MZR9_9GAMM|nr:hypothetical protein [Spiribacter halobius]PWG62224.1 hypothetical protein DEM34_13025 [Spiribacter halobius]UEX78133.1 hypothetical protein LMH63_00390 [Spiribacter halobius]